MEHRSALNENLHWYKDAIIYELHIKAFFDANNDGIGDFHGLIQKLDYLQELGITAIWLLPFYPSPLRDDGYDIADYYNINPNYGTIEQFQQFLKEAHRRNLKVITELVINHSSDQHPWFLRARNAPKGSPERNFYVWTDDPSQYKDVRIIFQDFESSNWTWDPVAQQYYWHRFFHHQPDLNFDNPLVQEEVFKMIDYWCAMGVDGFRLDAVPYLYEREGTNGENLPETHVFLKKLRAHVESRYPDTCFLAEANMWPEDSASYFGNGDECHMNYHFPVMPRMFMALQREDRYPITDIFDQTPEIPHNCQWAIFLRNHDELTLEMVTDEERDYMYKMYAKDPKARINLGIRHRLAPLMDNDRRKIELMNSLLFSLPGTPVIYYGDEIGMGDNFYLGDRDGVRTPMQWSPDRNAGFSAANPHRLYLPAIIDPLYHYESVNVETQRANTSSLFWYMKRMINMRKKYKAFGRGDMKVLNVDNPKILAFTRTYENETLLIVVNLSKFSQPAEINLAEHTGEIPVEIFSRNAFPTIKEKTPYFFTLGPHTYQWFELNKITTSSSVSSPLKGMNLLAWEDILSSKSIDQLQSDIIPAYIQKTNWFIGKNRKIHSITITHTTTVTYHHHIYYLLIIEISFEGGMPENYFIPLAFEKEKSAKNLQIDFPQAILSELIVGSEEGILCDALYTSPFHQALLHNLNKDTTDNDMYYQSNDYLKNYFSSHTSCTSRMYGGEQFNTSITFDNQFFLKLFRKIDIGVNPDLEMSKFLSDEANFSYTPAFIGSIQWQSSSGNIVLGMMEKMVENHGNGHGYMLERLHNFVERILARDRTILSGYKKNGTLSNPVSYETLPEDQKEFLGGAAAEQAHLLGLRTAEMHIALASNTEKDFKPEEFSLHYQRSLFAGMQSLVRESFELLQKKNSQIPTHLIEGVKKLKENKNAITGLLKQIHSKKLDVLKTRIHGFFGLKEILLTGKDVMIHNFNGNPYRSFSERRLKRSALRDVAAMIRSMYYVAYEGFFGNVQIQKEELNDLLPFADYWAHHVSSFFLYAYFEKIKGHNIVPEEEADKEVMLQTFILENAFHHLNYELLYRPAWVIVPLQIIQSFLPNEKK